MLKSKPSPDRRYKRRVPRRASVLKDQAIYASKENFKKRGFNIEPKKLLKPPVPFNRATYKHPTEKISANFLDYIEPLVTALDISEAGEKFESVVKLGQMIWNCSVLDTVRGNTEFVDQQRKIVCATFPYMSFLFDQMVNRKQVEFGHDLRLINNYKIYSNDLGGTSIYVEGGDSLTEVEDVTTAE